MILRPRDPPHSESKDNCNLQEEGNLMRSQTQLLPVLHATKILLFFPDLRVMRYHRSPVHKHSSGGRVTGPIGETDIT